MVGRHSVSAEAAVVACGFTSWPEEGAESSVETKTGLFAVARCGTRRLWLPSGATTSHAASGRAQLPGGDTTHDNNNSNNNNDDSNNNNDSDNHNNDNKSNNNINSNSSNRLPKGDRLARSSNAGRADSSRSGATGSGGLAVASRVPGSNNNNYNNNNSNNNNNNNNNSNNNNNNNNSNNNNNHASASDDEASLYQPRPPPRASSLSSVPIATSRAATEVPALAGRITAAGQSLPTSPLRTRAPSSSARGKAKTKPALRPVFQEEEEEGLSPQSGGAAGEGQRWAQRGG
ncbi:unnamed protein product, partial [Polarella glacialis]